jgi:UDP-glucose 4-epimerase
MPSSKPRILIPGGAGYIGSHVALVTLLTRKYRVTGKLVFRRRAGCPW